MSLKQLDPGMLHYIKWNFSYFDRVKLLMNLLSSCGWFYLRSQDDVVSTLMVVSARQGKN